LLVFSLLVLSHKLLLLQPLLLLLSQPLQLLLPLHLLPLHLLLLLLPPQLLLLKQKPSQLLLLKQKLLPKQKRKPLKKPLAKLRKPKWLTSQLLSN
jgi:hypothetical protein